MKELNIELLGCISGAGLPFGGIVGGNIPDAIRGAAVWGVQAAMMGGWIGIKWGQGGGWISGAVASVAGAIVGTIAGGFLGTAGAFVVGEDKAEEYYNKWLAPAFGGNGGNGGGTLG